MNAIEGGLRYYSYEMPDYESIKKVFGNKSANIYENNKNKYVYWGYTGSDEDPITQFFYNR